MPGDDEFYSPWTVRRLLAQRHQLQRARSGQFDPVGSIVQNKPFEGGFERGAVLGADLDRALGELPWITQTILRLTVMTAHSDRETAAALGVDRETVYQHRVDGLFNMASALGYPPDKLRVWRDQQRQRRRRSPTVWRKSDESTGDEATP